MSTAKPTLAEILSEHWEGFARQHRHMLSKAHYRAVRSVLACRTPVLGGRLYRCGSCQRKHFAYHSCNHRSCPQCGALEQKLWSEKQEARLLPSSYFMVTFTLPEQPRPLCQSHPKELYDLMLKQSAQTLKDIIATKNKGALTGFTSVLHTWGRKLQHHPHIHCIVPAAALSPGDQLVLPKKDNFLVHFSPLAKRFRNLMRLELQRQHPQLYQKLSDTQKHQLSIRTTWNVQLQHVGKGKTAVRYLARYVRKSGFTNNRIIGYSKDRTRLLVRWVNSTTNKPGVLKLKIHEFIRRWLLHVLPKGFARLRHYGLLSSASKKKRLKLRSLLGQFVEPEVPVPELLPHRCPHCDGELKFLRDIPRDISNRGPPEILFKR